MLTLLQSLPEDTPEDSPSNPRWVREGVLLWIKWEREFRADRVTLAELVKPVNLEAASAILSELRAQHVGRLQAGRLIDAMHDGTPVLRLVPRGAGPAGGAQ